MPIEITITDWIVAIAAVAAVLLSAALVVSTRRQVSIMKKQATILENQEREKLKARLIAKLITSHNRSAIEGNVSLLIFNNGKAIARDIKICINDRPALEYKPLAMGLTVVSGQPSEEIFPKQLESTESWSSRLLIAIGQPAAFMIKISWSDDSNELGSFERFLLAN